MRYSALSTARSGRWITGIVGFGILVAAAPASGDPLEDRIPAGMLIEMVDPTLCAPPPEDMSDDELIAMLDSDDPAMAPPVSGSWEHDGEEWRAYGQGWFNDGSSGPVVGTMIMLRSESDALQFLCLVVSPHTDTLMLHGEAALVGPDVESIDGDTFMAMGMLGERRAGIGEVLADSGSVTFEQVDDDTLEWSMTFDGLIIGMDQQLLDEGGSLTLEGELSRDDAMRVADWGSDDLADASAPAVDEEQLAAVREAFLDDLRLEIEPVLTPDNSDLVRNTVYRYDYDTFASQSDDSGWRSTREYFFYQDGEQLVPFQRPSSDADLSSFFDGLLASDFVLDEDSAEDFRDLLMTLTGEDFFEEEDVQLDNIVNHRPEEWIYFTGTFFDDYKAFVVYTDDEGRPEKVLYRLRQQPAS
ncbi:hypothetical protein M0534_08385 [Methylonatrum kenyense]|uniref:hypothetical protein n=1 Tax=Methylonatrum kenyense TaxID=455253 RepID=UPI0020BDA843|nr:hypothetical protein [Methylonatrum kenyense]MCK8516341.1 hypothetical protein [Methylonatrum kenyense]